MHSTATHTPPWYWLGRLPGPGWRAAVARRTTDQLGGDVTDHLAWHGEHDDAEERSGGPGRGSRARGRRGGPRGRGHHGSGFGPGHVGPGGFGPWGFGRPGRGRRGDVRAALLTLLAEGPSNGYRLMQAIAERSDDLWRPGPGSVYPALSQLQDEGLVEPADVDGRAGVALTAAGRRWVEEHADDPSPWDAVARPHEAHGTLRDSALELMAALRTVAEAGTPAQVAAARAVLDDARRSLYRLLADDSGGAAHPSPPDA